MIEWGKAKPIKESQNEKANFRVNLPGADGRADHLVCEIRGLDRSQINEIQSPETKSGASVFNRTDDLLSVANTAASLGESVAMGGDEVERVSGVQPVAKTEKARPVQPVAHKAQKKTGKRLRPVSISGHLWKPSGLKGWELYRRKPAISAKGNRSSKQEYLAYYSQKAVERERNARKEKKTKP